jgi:hypothetical protein
MSSVPLLLLSGCKLTFKSFLLLIFLSCNGDDHVLIAQIINISENTISDWTLEAE